MDEQINNETNQNLVVGYRQVMRSLASNDLRCVVIASDIDKEIRNRIEKACFDKGVALKVGETKKIIGANLKLEVACGVFAEPLCEIK